jgi:hypothetical protein
MSELVFDREKVHESLRQDLDRKTVKVVSLPEGDAELPDDGLPDEIEEDEPDDSEEDDE